ncbi:glutathione S-transferase [Pontivivens nitratireducens]|uniref:Glutathione S-transferase n=1 Tax=Pontivivens nitratireducens TaxID=2758038 RepID=A0A6G7VPH9_9RHOB|nr:glutathione S-transferase [Pontibrevibacter nitratireducens]QIK41822.1 glutathione S-transferase [Pontibrevibacter nitratireducens]
MTWTLIIGDRTYSSWSLRGWLLFEAFDFPVKVRQYPMYSDALAAALRAVPSGSNLVPQMVAEDGRAVWDTLAMAETLAEDHPQMWPADAGQRARARSMVAEVHSGFTALRGACGMNLRHVYDGFAPSDAVRRDLARVESLWAGADGWLFDAYSIADVFFAPIATRIVTYGLPVSQRARDYVQRHLDHGPLRRWRAMGLAENFVQPGYDLDLSRGPWPGERIPAEAVASGTPVNQTCPYSGAPVRPDALARIDGRIIGFCNPFCRDKSVADPGAWPGLQPLLR